MGVIPPWSMDAILDEAGNVVAGPEYDGASLRRIFSALLSGGPTATTARPGVVSGMGVDVINDVVYVGAGLVVVTTLDGSFVTGLDQEGAFPLEARHPTNSRIDRLVAEIVHTVTERHALVRVVPGIPAPSPSAPATPEGAESLGTVSVPNAAGGPAVFTPGQRYTAARGGIITVPNIAARNRLDQGTPGSPVFAAVGADLYVSTGDGWTPYGPQRATLTGSSVIDMSLGTPVVAAAVIDQDAAGHKTVSMHFGISDHGGLPEGGQNTLVGTLASELRPNTIVPFTAMAVATFVAGYIETGGVVRIRHSSGSVSSGAVIRASAAYPILT